MKIRINKAHFPVTVLGTGRRIGIWTQGCHIHCPRCVSKDTWDDNGGNEIELDALLSWCKDITQGALDGVTISGGEPFEQPEALGMLLEGLAAWRAQIGRSFDILCYSGMSYRRLQAHFSELLSKLDCIIAEPYVDHLPEGGIWRGSSNQPLIPLSSLGRDRYQEYTGAAADHALRFQVSVDHSRIWFIGIPKRGDLENLEKLCEERGVTLGRVSWQA